LGNLIKGTVGEGPAIKFMTYRKQAANLPRARDILDGRVTRLNVKQVDICYALTTSLVYALVDDVADAESARSRGEKNSHDAMYKCADRFFEFIMNNFEPELVVCAARNFMAATRKTPLKPAQIPCWKNFVKQYSSLIPSMSM
jgi:hypothetical protein